MEPMMHNKTPSSADTNSLSSQEKLAHILREYPRLNPSQLDALVRKVVSMNARFEIKQAKLFELIEEMNQAIKPYLPCKAGCHHCCHMVTMIFEHEAKAMSAASGRPYQRPRARPPMITLTEANRFNGSACPFLEDGSCSIYEARPLICRIHHSLEASGDACALPKGGELVGQSVERIDPDHFEVPYVEMSRQHSKNEPWGAIQEFFPITKSLAP
jgi:Fe-S-cluster containining protein